MRQIGFEGGSFDQKFDKYAAEADIIENIGCETVNIGFVGEMVRGKSTVINSLLGDEAVPVDVVPTTAVTTYIRWGAEKTAEIHFTQEAVANGYPEVEQIPFSELEKYVTMVTKESYEMSKKVESAVVAYPSPFLKNNIQIIDTPGLNNDDRIHDNVMKVLPEIDIAIMVISPDSPLSESEASFIRNNLMAGGIERIIIVLNRFDLVRQRYREELLEDIKNRIKDSVLEKTANLYGKDSKEYKDAEQKLGGIRLYPISARDALDGKLNGDMELLAGSGIDKLEDEIFELINRGRMRGLKSSR